MVLLTLADISLSTGIFLVSKTWSWGKWLIYGKSKSREEILLEKIKELEERELKVMEKSQICMEQFQNEIKNLRESLTKSQ
jgi:hypothetical protein